MKKYFAPFLLTMLIFVSCNSREKQERKADILLTEIKKLISEDKLNVAKIRIDSLHFSYPRLVNKRKIAASLEDSIVLRESSRSLGYYDSMLPELQLRADSIGKYFRLEKNDKYQQYGNYIYKTQTTENNTDRNYLKAYVDENCDFYLVSNYSGATLGQSWVEVSTNSLFARSDTIPASSAAYHSFSNEGKRWETLSFKNDADNGIASFISQFSDSQIKVILNGKRTYTYYLANTDKKAISAAYHLWVVKKDLLKIQKEIKKANLKIEKIRKSSGN